MVVSLTRGRIGKPATPAPRIEYNTVGKRNIGERMVFADARWSRVLADFKQEVSPTTGEQSTGDISFIQ